MNQLEEIMIKRLEGKGLHSHNIPGFIRDLANSISSNPQSTLEELNKRLHLLGWNELELDEYTLQLAMASFEAVGFSKQGGTQRYASGLSR